MCFKRDNYFMVMNIQTQVKYQPIRIPFLTYVYIIYIKNSNFGMGLVPLL